MSTKNMANREVCDLIFVDYENKVPFLNLDFANVSTTELTGESTFAYGGKGYPKRVRFAGEKSGTLTIETQIQTVKLWQLITGGERKTSAEFVARAVLSADETGKVITLKETPVENSVYVYAQDDDCGTKLDCTVSGAAVTLDTALDAGAKVIVYYMKSVAEGVERINVKSTSMPKNFIVYGDTVMQTEDGKLLPYRMVAAKCALQSNLSLSFSNNGDPGTVTITCDLLADADNNILDLILIDEEHTEAPEENKEDAPQS